MLYQVSAPHFVAGLWMENAYVVGAAPIIKWMIGKHYTELRDYCAKKGWSFKEVECTS